MKDFLADLEHLVSIESPSHHADGIAEIASWFAARYEAAGLTVSKPCFDESLGPCVEAYTGDGKEFDLHLVGHMDTVLPLGTILERPFRIDSDRAFGPGVIDMKSGLLLMLYAIERLARDKRLPRVCITLNPDEEIGSPSSTEWLENRARQSHFTIVLEPARANGALVSQRKGVGKFTLDFHGKAVHAGVEPQKGRSAIGELGHWIVALHDLTDYAKGTTVNVGTVRGGTVSNAVAGHANCEVDLRFTEADEATRVQDAIKAWSKAPRIEGVTVEHRTVGFRGPMTPTDETMRLCRLVETVGKELDIDIEWAATGGGSDGNTTAAVGTPTIDGLGPIGGLSHSVDEYLVVSSIEPRLRLLEETIARIGKDVSRGDTSSEDKD